LINAPILSSATPGDERHLRSLDVVPVLLFCRSRQIRAPNSSDRERTPSRSAPWRTGTLEHAIHGKLDMQAISGEERRPHGCAGSGGNGMMVTSSSARRRKASFIVAATMSRSFLSALMLASIESSSRQSAR
jgi:hypothetical protein